MKKIILICLIIFSYFWGTFFLLAQAEEQDTNAVHACRTAWNDRMQEVDIEYQEGLTNTLFQKKRTADIIESEQITNNLRSYGCKLFQICELVRRSMNQEESDDKIIGQMWRCSPKSISALGGIIQECSNEEIQRQFDARDLWDVCIEQAEARIKDVEAITEIEVNRSYGAKKTSNFIQYLIELNKKIEKLTLDFGGFVGKLFAVTKKMTCVQNNCQ